MAIEAANGRVHVEGRTLTLTAFAIGLFNTRRKRGLTQRQLAAMTGINVATISRYERAIVGDVKLSQVERLATALKVSTGYLVSERHLILG